MPSHASRIRITSIAFRSFVRSRASHPLAVTRTLSDRPGAVQ
jgi:hypothetical protein